MGLLSEAGTTNPTSILRSVRSFLIDDGRVTPFSNPGQAWKHVLPANNWGVIISHLFLIHNWRLEWIYKINSPLWSIAVEWQIYFLFPVLLWILKVFGRLFCVSAGFALGFSVFLIVPMKLARDMCCWYVGLFSLGMVAAQFTASPRIPGKRGQQILWFCLTLATTLCAWYFFRNRWIGWLVDSSFGLATAFLLIACGRSTAYPGQARPWIVSVLQWPPLVGLGHFSYSLYLIHYPVLELFDGYFRAFKWSQEQRLIGLLGMATPVCVGFAWMFSLVFERPFMRTTRAISASRSLNAVVTQSTS